MQWNLGLDLHALASASRTVSDNVLDVGALVVRDVSQNAEHCEASQDGSGGVHDADDEGVAANEPGRLFV